MSINNSKHIRPNANFPVQAQDDSSSRQAKRETLTAHKDKKNSPTSPEVKHRELQKKMEQEEVAGRHKNDGQKHFKGAQ